MRHNTQRKRAFQDQRGGHVGLLTVAQQHRIAGEAEGRKEREQRADEAGVAETAGDHDAEPDQRNRHRADACPTDPLTEQPPGEKGGAEGRDAGHENGLRHRRVEQRQDEAEPGQADRDAGNDAVQPGMADHREGAATMGQGHPCAHQDENGERAVEDDLPAVDAVGETDQDAAQAPAGCRGDPEEDPKP